MSAQKNEKKLLVILGITGQQGGSVAQVLQSAPEWRIRGITRDPSKPSNAHLISAGIELVAGDLDDPSTLARAFDGADAIFSVTDFWQFVQNPESPVAVHAAAAARGVEPNVLAMEAELRQGKAIVDAAAAAHARRPLHRFVLSTLADSRKWSGGELTNNLHFDGKDQYCEYLKQTYPALAQVSSYVHVGYYLSNAFSFPCWTPRRDEGDGSYVLPTSGVPNGRAVPFVNPPQDVGWFVEALLQRAPPRTTLLGYCELLTYERYAELWGRTLGVRTRAEYMDAEALRAAGLPAWMAQEISDSGRFATQYGWTGGEPNVKGPEECGVDMSKLTRVEEWIREQDWKLKQ